MGTGHIVTDDEVIQEGTSLFIQGTREVIWITEIHEDHVHVETVTDSIKMDKDRFVQRIRDADYVVESQPVTHTP